MAPRPILKPRCENCRHKKKKCDYVTPKCGPCLRLGEACRPFKKSFVFLDTENAASQRRRHYYPPTSTTASPGPYHHPAAGALYKSATQHHLFYQFLMGYLPHEVGTLEIASTTWVEALRDAQHVPFMRMTAGALGMKALALQTRDEAHEKQSMRLYDHALMTMRRALLADNVDAGASVQLLVTSLALMLYELLAPSEYCQLTGGGTPYAMGISALLQRLGPSFFDDARYHSIFLRCRTILNVNALFIGEPLFAFLQTDDWMTLPWGKSEKSDSQLVLDITLQIPRLMHLTKAIEQQSRVTDRSLQESSVHSDFFRLFDAINKNLHEWHAQFLRKRLPLPPFTIGYNVDYAPGHVLSEEYSCPTLDDANALQSCWAGLLYIHESLAIVASSLGEAGLAPSPPRECLSCIELKALADSVVRMLPQFVRAETGFLGSKHTAIPLMAAMQLYARQGLREELQLVNGYVKSLIGQGLEYWRFLLHDGDDVSVSSTAGGSDF